MKRLALKSHHWVLAVGLGGYLLLNPAGAQAQPVSAADRALATSLFKEGRQLMVEKKFEAACNKFAESQKLNPGGGTLLNLASCHEKVGRTATAWAEYTEALGIARRDAAWNHAIPIDPGEQVVEAKAKGYQAFRTTLRTPTQEPKALEVTIPPMKKSAKAPMAPAKTPNQQPPRKPQKSRPLWPATTAPPPFPISS